MRVEAKDGEATIWIYDAIGEMFGPDAVTAKGVRDRLQSLRAIDRLTIRINSPGGEVDSAVAIHTLLSEYPATKTVKVDGIAASAASIIAMAGDRIEMANGAKIMIHDPWGLAIGNWRELLHASEVAKQYSSSAAQMYSSRTGKSVDDVLAAMAAETYFTDSEAIEWGLADAASDGDGASIAAKFTPSQIMQQATIVAQLAFAAMLAQGADKMAASIRSMESAARDLASKRVALARVRNK